MHHFKKRDSLLTTIRAARSTTRNLRHSIHARDLSKINHATLIFHALQRGTVSLLLRTILLSFS